MSDFANAQPSGGKLASVPPIKAGSNTSFPSLKQVDAGLLNVGYAEAGPGDGPVVVNVEYRINPADFEAFAATMAQVKLHRLRNGASRWAL